MFSSFTRKACASFPVLRSWGAYAALPAAGIITAPILAHALGAEGRGQLAGMLQPLTLAGAIASLGVPSAVTFYVARNYRSQDIMRQAIRISLIMSAFVGATLLLYSHRISSQLAISSIAMLTIWIFFLPGVFISIRRAHVQGLRGYAAIDLERLLSAAFRVIIIFLLWLAGVQSVVIFALAYVLPGIAASIVLRKPPQTEEAFDVHFPPLPPASFLRYALLASFGTVAAAMSARLDQAIMPAIVPSSELGHYSVAVSVAEISTIITQVTTRNVLSEVSAGVGVRKIFWSIIAGGIGQLVLSFLIIAALPLAVPFVFGTDFVPAIRSIQILLLATFLSHWATVCTAYLAGLGRPGLASIGQATAALITAIGFWTAWTNMSSEMAAWISVWSQLGALTIAVTLLVRVQCPRYALRYHSSKVK